MSSMITNLPISSTLARKFDSSSLETSIMHICIRDPIGKGSSIHIPDDHCQPIVYMLTSPLMLPCEFTERRKQCVSTEGRKNSVIFTSNIRSCEVFVLVYETLWCG